MKKTFKFTQTILLTLLITTFSCSKDDDPISIMLQDLEVTIDENPTSGQVIGTIQSNSNSTLSFNITSQTPNGALEINENTGALTVADPTLFDFETNPTITAIVSANEAQNTATVTITINNVSELSVQDFSTNIDENPTDGQSLGTIQASGDTTLTYSITTQSPNGALNINANSGELTVANPTLFDFEINPTITATVSVDNAGTVQTAAVTISLNDVDEIVAQDTNLTFDENPSNGDVIGALQITSGSNLTYAITFQNPAGAFTINQTTGELLVADATLFDHETNPNMLATISVSNNISTVSKNAFVALNDVNEIGEFKYGGVIFWIDPTSNNNEGLVISLNNQGTSVSWGCSGTTTGATGIAIGTGETNTATIMASGCTSGSAAEIVSNLNLNGYDDWFLPSSGEWAEVYNNLSVIQPVILSNGGDDLSLLYWSSSENDAYNVAAFLFTPPGDGTAYSYQKSSTTIKTRAIRKWAD